MNRHAVLVCLVSLTALLAMSLVVAPTARAAPVMKWTFHAGDAFLAGLNPLFSPDVAKATSGDTVTIAGTGTFNPGGPVTGGGTFIHKNPDGTVRATGTWTSVAVVSYETFGNGISNGFPRTFYGGILVLVVHIIPDGAPAGFFLVGTLTITCLIGESVPSGVDEGIALSVPAIPITFGESVSGNTLFVLSS